MNYLWNGILKAQYGDLKLRVTIGGRKIAKVGAMSVWWADIIGLDKTISEDFFGNNCLFHIGDGFSISFWHSHWLEEGIIKLLVPSLFSKSFRQGVSIAGMGGWLEGEWYWHDFGISILSEEDMGDMATLYGLLQQKGGSAGGRGPDRAS